MCTVTENLPGILSAVPMPHCRLIMRAGERCGGGHTWQMIRPMILRFALEVGYVSLDGRVRDVHTHLVSGKPYHAQIVANFARDGHDPAKGLWVARAVGREDISTAVFRALDYSEMDIPACKLQIAMAMVGKNRYAVRVGTDKYAHAVHFVLPEGAISSDNYFDLLPGEHERRDHHDLKNID